MHVLIVEDERSIAENLYDFLEACGHQCDFAHSVAAARLLCANTRFDALLLDRNLPDGDGAKLLRQLRAAGNFMPVLMLTARDTLDDKIEGFVAGADDYLVKPFALKEVELRLLALLRRSGPRNSESVLAYGDLSFDVAARALSAGGQAVLLPPKGLRLIEMLLQQPQRVLTRRELEVAIWGHEQETSDNLRSVLHTVRKALAGHSAVSVHNLHGQGYRLEHA
jgi:DNA-binding response OmpR family regulator